MKSFLTVVFATLLILGGTQTVTSCPACKEGYAAGSKQAAIGQSYSISVLFMLGVPFTIVTIAGIAYARHMKRIKKG